MVGESDTLIQIHACLVLMIMLASHACSGIRLLVKLLYIFSFISATFDIGELSGEKNDTSILIHACGDVIMTVSGLR